MGSFWKENAPHTIRASAATTITKGCLSANDTSLAIMNWRLYWILVAN
jgi:hypothetical protein